MAEPRVTHVITGLGVGGGAENLLLRLLEKLDGGREGHRVISLRAEVPSLEPEIEALGVSVDELRMSVRPGPGEAMRLGRALRESPADVVQTWMLHSNVIGGVAARIATSMPVVWGVHLSRFDHSSLGSRAVVMQQVERLCSWGVPTKIVACSTSSEQAMVEMGYRRRRIVTIANGFDVAHFAPDPRARDEVRAELGIGGDELVVGHVARFHPVKDHAGLLEAAALVLKERPETRFVLCGENVDDDNPLVRALIEPFGDRVLTLGQRNDVPRVINAFDLAVSSSSSEALSLAIGEAMACGVPVVGTRTGESEELIGDTGRIVAIRDPEGLAEAILEMIAIDPQAREELGRRARERIKERYSLQAMVEGYRELWAELGRSES